MMITEDSIIETVTVLEDGQINIKRADRILRNGVVVASVPHRHVLEPGADLTDEDTRVCAIALAVWTPAVVAAHKARAELAPILR
ncbi:MAG TPA: hypothetical protein VL966_06865 [Alphaproteobacteria bacterium]|jgi:hypothetical protein|nr:hypothetical protein [Alphaproteobacteria bacterium]